MKLPRDLGGDDLAKLLGKYGFQPTRQTGSHLRLTSHYKGAEYHVTIPKHKPLQVGTLSGIVDDVARYLEVERQDLIDALFG